ncbi:MAG: sigma-54 dependent transcriptional regulator [Pirellulaceae bacterium]|nr:sigma-54-dependent Fis family transcriptional regulator [Planctomycetales bacterium]
MTAKTHSASIDLLIVDDDEELRSRAGRYFRELGYHVEEAADGAEALRLSHERHFNVAILDMMMPGLSGLDVLRGLQADETDTQVIFLTGKGSIELAVQAMQLGAHDFLTKPIRFKELEAVVIKAYEANQLRQENRQLRTVLRRTQASAEMVGTSPAMREVYRLIERAADSDKPILIQGESGTGKELVAKALHQSSPLRDRPLIVINCAALPETLLESELFGHEKGAFTGANSTKPGLFEVADGGTIFIDEIGEMSPTLQPKLLRVLEDGSLRRIGSLKERRVHVRVLAATNRDLNEEVKQKRFREDLFYRINVMTLQLPPLRERGDDVLLLAERFAGPGWEFESDAIQAIRRYNWPGNVRQLINAVERAKILADDEVIRCCNLPPEVTQETPAVIPPTSDVDLAALNRAHVVNTLRRERGNKKRAAELLGISRRSLYRLLEKFHITSEELETTTTQP